MPFFPRSFSFQGFTALTLLSIATLSFAARPAGAQVQTTINFDNFAADTSINPYFIGSPYSTQGFTFTSSTGPFDPNGGFVAVGANDGFGDGETSLVAIYDGSATLTQNDGQVFDFNAIDLGPVYGNSQGTLYAGPTRFVGFHADGTTVEATVTTTSGRYQAFNFTSFTGLKSLTFVPEGGSGVEFDNVIVTSAAPVPEASTTVSFGLLLALGLGGGVIAARKKKASMAA